MFDSMHPPPLGHTKSMPNEFVIDSVGNHSNSKLARVEWMMDYNNNKTSTYSGPLWDITSMVMYKVQRLWTNCPPHR